MEYFFYHILISATLTLHILYEQETRNHLSVTDTPKKLFHKCFNKLP